MGGAQTLMQLLAGRFVLDLNIPKIMGILNVTPDSFSDGGRFQTLDQALFHVESLINDGADIIDIGAESTRPNAEPVSSDEELRRLLPIIEGIQARFNICLSVDTSNPLVMREVLAHKVDMINDVRAFTEPDALETLAELNDQYCNHPFAICLMHLRGTPKTMQQNLHYDDLIAEICDFLRARSQAVLACGLHASRIVLDPGFGFGKSTQDNLRLIKHGKDFSLNTDNTEFAVLMGLSRKGSLGEILQDPQADRSVASVTASLLSIIHGASIVRVHDVKPMKMALQIYQAFLDAEK